ncbi:HU family DNA-binding protein [Candidatus Ferrigenium straubiae]|jgi:DNA-binding protein HU-beta|uniref:HU family DNA-binding protein n=1 Tax=Candidatus Ferrigenium straubiae TaxID=2919506 RepID=UPI003F4AED63
MTKQELIDAIAAGTDQSKKNIDQVLNHLGLAVMHELKNGGEVTLPGLGKLHVEHKEARKGRNPSTRAEIDIPAKNVPKFSAAKALKDAVNS